MTRYLQVLRKFLVFKFHFLYRECVLTLGMDEQIIVSSSVFSIFSLYSLKESIFGT